jgi:hypothetical protein
MSDHMLKRLQGIGILLLFGLAGVVAIALACLPIAEAYDASVEARDQVERFEAALARDSQVQAIDTTTVIHTTGSSATSLGAQRAIVDLVQAAGLTQQQLNSLPTRTLERSVVQHAYRVQLTGDLDQLVRFFGELAKRKPVIFVDNLTLAIGSAHRGDLAMSVEIQLSAYAIGGAGAP